MFRATSIPRTLSAFSVAPRTSTRTLAQMSLIGRITAPEKLVTKNGESFYKFGISDRVRNDNGEYEAHYYNVACFDQTREEKLASLNKGDYIHVIADVSPRTYEVEGKKVMAYNLTASEYILSGGGLGVGEWG